MKDRGTLEQAIAKWDAGDSVWTIEMGGLGPGYEQCIQVGAFEMAKRLKALAPLPTEKESLNQLLDDELHALIKAVSPVLDGLSGAQAGAINNLAYHFVHDGYSETLDQVPDDRLIQCGKRFPALA